MKAMILAAGRGKRMMPLTEKTHKALLAPGGKPLIVRHIENLVAANHGPLVVNLCHHADQLKEALGDGSKFDTTISYSFEQTALEAAGGIAKALPLLGEHPFIALSADIYCEEDLGTLHGDLAGGDAEKPLAHLLLVPNPDHNPEGDVSLDESGKVTPPSGKTWTYSGIGVYHPGFFDGVEIDNVAKLRPLLIRRAQEGRVSGKVVTGTWTDVGTPERLEALEAHLRSVTQKRQ